jgi:hypothetical protein
MQHSYSYRFGGSEKFCFSSIFQVLSMVRNCEYTAAAKASRAVMTSARHASSFYGTLSKTKATKIMHVNSGYAFLQDRPTAARQMQDLWRCLTNHQLYCQGSH